MSQKDVQNEPEVARSLHAAICFFLNVMKLFRVDIKSTEVGYACVFTKRLDEIKMTDWPTQIR